MLPLNEYFLFAFDLTFRPAALLSLVGVLVNVFVLILLAKKALRNAVTIYFSLFVVSIIFWGISEFMVRISATPDGALFWLDFGVIGPATIGVLFFSFVRLYVNPDRGNEKIYFQILLFAPVFVFFFLAWNTELLVTKNLTEAWWGWYPEFGKLFLVYLLWVEVFFAVGVFLLVKLILKTKDRTKKIQSMLIVIGVLIPLVSGSLTDALLPYFGKSIMTTAVLSTAIMNAFIAYAIVRYKLFIISPSAAMSSIVNTMNEALIVLNPNGYIDTTNPAAVKLSGYSEKELSRGVSWETFYEKGFTPIFHGKDVRALEEVLTRKDKRLIPIEISLSAILSPAGEVIGIVVVVSDVTEEKKLLEELENSSEELKLAKYELERKIGEMLNQT